MTAPHRPSTRDALLWITAFSLFVILLEWMMSEAIPRDQLEAVFWGRSGVSVSEKHPTLSGWIHYGWLLLFGNSNLSGFALNLTNVLVSLGLLWVLLREIGLSPTARAVSFWSVAASVNLYLLLIKYNANSAPLPFWLLGILGLWIGVHRGQFLGWVIAGIAASLAMLTKYHTALWLLAAFLWLLSGPQERRSWRTAGPWVALGIFTIVMAVHFWDMARFGWPGLGYGAANLTEGSGLAGHLLNPLKYFVIQLVGASPGLVALLWALRQGRAKEAGPIYRMLLFFGVFFPLSPMIVAVITGGELGAIWGIGTAMLTAPFLLMHFRGGEARPSDLRVAARTAKITLAAFTVLLLMGQPFREAEYPIRQTQAALHDALGDERLAALAVVAGKSREAQGATWYMAGHPLFLSSRQFDARPWITRHLEVGALVLIEGRPDAFSFGGFGYDVIESFQITIAPSDAVMMPRRGYEAVWTVLRLTEGAE